jgi:N-acetylmuramoyl-L-alanine amidase
MIPFDTVGWHAGESRWRDVRGVNSHSVGIEIVNWGQLRRSGAGGWLSRTGQPVTSSRVVLDEHKNAPGRIEGWEIFDEPQVTAAVAAARAIVGHYGIGPNDLVGHDDVSPLRKVDPGPAFGMDEFRALVFGMAEDARDDIRFRVRSPTGLNLRTEPAVSARLIKNLPDETVVHVIEKPGTWWLVAEVIGGNDDVTGYVHSRWLQPA